MLSQSHLAPPPTRCGRRRGPERWSALPRCLVLLLLGAGVLSAVDAGRALERARELLQAMPDPPVVEPREHAALAGDTPMAEGVSITPGRRVVLTGKTLFDQGPTDGLEVVCCLQGGKNHESLGLLTTGNAQLVKAAFIAALAVEGDGKPAHEMSAVPARGVPLLIEAVWRPDPLLASERWVRAPVSALVRNRITDRAFPTLPYVFTGSRFHSYTQTVPGTGERKRVRRFMLGVTLSVAVNFDEPDTLLASPFPLAAQDDAFEVNSAIAPPVGSPISFVFTRIEMPLVLDLDPAGVLRDLDGAALDDPALQERLAAVFAADAAVTCRAVQVRAPAAVDDATVVACRERIMAAAVAAEVWAVPVFSLQGGPPPTAQGL